MPLPPQKSNSPLMVDSYPPSCSPLEDNAENRLKNTLFVVEATSYEQHSLWAAYSSESDRRRSKEGMKWEQVNPGWLVTVGKLDKRPCCISVSWNRIDGHLVMFWYPCSQVSDSLQSEAWITANFSGKWDKGTRRAWTDAGNFHHCIHAIREANESLVNVTTESRP